MKKVILSAVLIFSLINLVAGIDDFSNANKERLEFGHVVDVKKIKTDPESLIPGESGNLTLLLENTGSSFVKDIRVTFDFPDEIAFYEDVNLRKIHQLNPGFQKEISFNIRVLPDTAEGIYKANLTVDYINRVAEDRQDVYSVSMAVRSELRIFGQISGSDIYQGNNIGDVTLKFVNNDLGDVRFLTIDIQETDGFEVISSKRQYIGDLDSDDFETLDIKLKINPDSTEIDIPLKMTYKDALNKEYTEDIIIKMNIRTAEELGIKTNSTTTIIISVIIAIVLLYFLYRSFFRKKKKIVK